MVHMSHVSNEFRVPKSCAHPNAEYLRQFFWSGGRAGARFALEERMSKKLREGILSSFKVHGSGVEMDDTSSSKCRMLGDARLAALPTSSRR